MLKENSPSDRKNSQDRYIRKKFWTNSPRNRSQSPKSTSSSYEKYLSDGLLNSSQEEEIRPFTIVKANQKKKHQKEVKLKHLRRDNLQPFRKFRVAGWKDNFYSNLLDWSWNNYICAGFHNDLFLYNMTVDYEFKKQIFHTYPINLNGEDLTAIKNSPFHNKISLGSLKGSFKVYDYDKEEFTFSNYDHDGRIATIEWSPAIIITGCKDQRLRFFDLRQRKAIKMSSSLENSHAQEICGVKKMQNLVASGGNDNMVHIYDLRNQKRVDSYMHSAAIKAITWIDRSTLITGGGTADKKIKIWQNGIGITSQIETGSQVCSVCWSETTQEIVSCQGFSLNQIILWSRQGERQFTFHGHGSRVLYSAISPTGEYLASGAGDRTLKVWKLFKSKEKSKLLSWEAIR